MRKVMFVFVSVFIFGLFLSPTYAQFSLQQEAPYEIYIPTDIDNTKNVHSNYNNNTDTCAACHATHLALGGSLLQWNTISATCMACHDGTVTTTYDVLGGRFLDYKEGDYYPTSGGLFSSDGDDKNVSMHNVSEMVSVSAAPGGTTVGIDALLRTKNDPDYTRNSTVIAWDIPFSCASCHNPHGAGGNARLLQQDPNGVARRNPLVKAQMFTFDEVATKRLLWSVYPDVNQDGDRDLLWKGKPVKPYTLITAYPFHRDTKVYRRARKNAFARYELITDYEIDNSSGATVFKFSSDPSKKDGVKNYYNIYVDGIPGVTVGVRVKNYLKIGEFVEYKYGINEFCAACHEDYNTASKKFFKKSDFGSRYFEPYPDQYGYYSGSGGRKEKLEGGDGTSGMYSQAYRHQVGMVWETNTPGLRFERDPWNPNQSIIDQTKGKFIVNCLTCHVAHGISKDYWERTIGERPVTAHEEMEFPTGIFTFNELQELAPPSALKRMPNMAVCEACHRKGDESVQYTINEEKD